MRLIDPLYGYKIASAVLSLQLAFALSLIILIMNGELHFNDQDNAIGIMLGVHILAHTLEYARILLQMIKSRRTLLIFINGALTFLNIALYQGAVFYAQVKYLKSNQDAQLEIL